MMKLPVEPSQLAAEGHFPPEKAKAIQAWGTRVGGVSLVLAVVFGYLDGGFSRFIHSYLVAFAYFLSLTLGALFFVIAHHLFRAKWSVVVRRLAEITASNIPLVALFFLPVLLTTMFGGDALYPWADADVVTGNHLLEHKTPFLNKPFFLLRWVIYFSVWSFLVRFFVSHSIAQDADGDPAHSERTKWRSAPSMILFAVTLSFAAMDLLMSLDPEWFSTMWGVYFFAGANMSHYAFITLFAIYVQKQGRLQKAITTEHYHDLGKMTFAFLFFWGYIGFSQYMLIWYANIPEETQWFQERHNAWLAVSLILIFVHFVIPFPLFMSRWSKRIRPLLIFFTSWLLVAHWIDMYWIVMPNFDGDHIRFGVVDVAAFVGLAGLFLAGIGRNIGGKALIPLKDPRLEQSLAFRNM